MENKIIYETENFFLRIPNKPHITRKEGGHIYIKKKENPPQNMYEFTQKELIELIRLTAMAGEAYEKAMNIRGVKVRRINYQDNGNWAFINGKKPATHLHLYGRTEYSDKQKWGEALYFPNQFSDYYNEIEPINMEDVMEIRKQIDILANTDKYKLENWNL